MPRTDCEPLTDVERCEQTEQQCPCEYNAYSKWAPENCCVVNDSGETVPTQQMRSRTLKPNAARSCNRVEEQVRDCPLACESIVLPPPATTSSSSSDTSTTDATELP